MSTAPTAASQALVRLGGGVLLRAAEWWHTVRIGAQLVVLACAPQSWRSIAARHALAQQVVRACANNLLWFALMVALATVVITRIVLVTASSYGLSRYAVEMVVRVLVLELVPLTAALYAALRYSITGASDVFKLRHRGRFESLRAQGGDPVARWVLPGVAAGVLAVFCMAAVCCALAMALTYFIMYGVSPHGAEPFMRSVGKVFSPAVVVIFLLKLCLFAVAVGVAPMATALQNLRRDTSRVGVALEVLVRMFALLLVFEVLSLAGNYS